MRAVGRATDDGGASPLVRIGVPLAAGKEPKMARLKGIWIIEGLDLSAARAGRYELICLPVELHGSDGAPARAVLRPISEGHRERI
jgi:hypothetical protein